MKPYTDIGTSLETAVTKAKIGRNITFHKLRHTAASNLTMSGVSTASLQKILGHKTLKMTTRYTHLTDDHLKGEVKKLSYQDKVCEKHITYAA